MNRIYIHDKCMEQLFDLPKIVQKKVLEFQKKFRENSKSAAIHLEPISTFKDPYLRTARIDDKYRAIIKVPDTGSDYYLLWVDNHDEAMDWAKTKIFHWNENTQTAQIFTAPETTVATEVAAEAKAEHLFAHLAEQQLLAIGVPKQSLPLVYAIRNLDDLDRCEKYLPAEVYEHLFYLHDGANYEILLAQINDGKINSQNKEDQVNSANNKRSFVEVDDEMMEEILNGELSKWQIFLHPSQRKLVELGYNGPVKVTGGAGTGKTVVALHRLKFLASLSDNQDTRKIVFTTYTNALTTNLSVLAQQLGVPQHKVLINNIDTLVRDLGKEYGLITKDTITLDMYASKSSTELWETLLDQILSEFDSDFLFSEYQQVILFQDITTQEAYLSASRIGRGKPITRKQRMEVWRLVEKYQELKQKDQYVDRGELFNQVTAYLRQQPNKPFKHLIADEIQDISNIELRFLRALVEEKDNDLFLVGDPYQNIYKRKVNFTSAGVSVRGKRSKQLRINYRTSEEIKRLALSAVKGVAYDDFDGEAETLNGYLSLFHGRQPAYEIYKTKNDELDAIIQRVKSLREEGLKYNDIAIACRLKDAIKEVKNRLHKENIPYNDYNASSNNSKHGIALSTFHNMKGLEFKAVLLADVNNRTSPLVPQRLHGLDNNERESNLQSERSLLYVAITRAISVLLVTGTGVKSDMLGI